MDQKDEIDTLFNTPECDFSLECPDFKKQLLLKLQNTQGKSNIHQIDDSDLEEIYAAGVFHQNIVKTSTKK